MPATAAEGATLYVTLEPCNHFGRTPPCTHRILAAGIQRVIIAMADPNPDVTGGGAAYLREKGPVGKRRVCARRALQQNDWFVKYIRTKQPFVTAKCAATLDGRIAASSGDARWVTGEASRAFVHQLRHSMDAIMVGRQTVVRDDPSLTTRLPGAAKIRFGSLSIRPLEFQRKPRSFDSHRRHRHGSSAAPGRYGQGATL